MFRDMASEWHINIKLINKLNFICIVLLLFFSRMESVSIEIVYIMTYISLILPLYQEKNI